MCKLLLEVDWLSWPFEALSTVRRKVLVHVHNGSESNVLTCQQLDFILNPPW